MSRNVDTIYFKERYNDVTGIYHRIEVIPAYPLAGPRGDEFTYEELPDGVLIDSTDVEASFDKIPLGIIETPSIKVNLELQNAPSNFRLIVKAGDPWAEEFPGDSNFDQWYANRICTTWVLKKRTATTSWVTTFIGVQRISPGVTIEQSLSDDGSIVETFEAEILSIGAYLLQNVSMEHLCNKVLAQPGLDVKTANATVDVIRTSINGSRITHFIIANTMIEADNKLSAPAWFKFWRLSDLFTIMNAQCRTLYRVLLRDVTLACDLLRMPHQNIQFYRQHLDTQDATFMPGTPGLNHDEIYFIGQYFIKYMNEELKIEIPNLLAGGLLVEDTLVFNTGVAGSPIQTIENGESLRDYENCYDFLKDVSENFYTKFTWTISNAGIKYRFDHPKSATTSTHHPLFTLDKISSDSQVVFKKEIGFNAVRSAEVNIDSQHKSARGDEKFISTNDTMTASESKIEIKGIFHNVPDTINVVDDMREIEQGVSTSGGRIYGYVNNVEKVVCSKLYYFYQPGAASSTDTKLKFIIGQDSIRYEIPIGGEMPVRVSNKLSVAGENFPDTTDVHWTYNSGWQGKYTFYAALKQMGRNACLPHVLSVLALRDFGSRSQSSSETEVDYRSVLLTSNNIGDIVEWDTYDNEIDSRLQLNKAAIVKVNESVQNNQLTIGWFIFGE